MRTQCLFFGPYAVLVLGIAACRLDSPNLPSSVETKTQTIDSTGGAIAIEGALLTIPPGALSTAQSITVTATKTPGPARLKILSPVFDFQPAGLEFALPVSIEVKLSVSGAVNPVLFWTKKESSTEFDELPSKLTAATVSAQVRHFSSGVVAESAGQEDAGTRTGFVSTANLLTARGQATATLLANGKVLIAGGTSALVTSVSPSLASTELFDPTGNGGRGSFAALGNLATGRREATATRLANGKVLIVGGTGSSQEPLASAELFDPDGNGGAGSFIPTGRLTVPRAVASAVRLRDGRVLVVGGVGATGSLSSAELYDPSANGGVGAFTPTGSLTFGRGYATATLLTNGKVLVAGGANGDERPTRAELFDPSGNSGTGAFTTSGSLGSGRASATATLLTNGKVLIAGGGVGFLQLATTELFDPEGNGGLGAFTPGASMRLPRAGATATLLRDGTVLIAGGEIQATSTAEIFDPAANSSMGQFTFGPTLVEPRARTYPTATLLLNGKVLVAGGGGLGTLPLSSAELFE